MLIWIIGDTLSETSQIVVRRYAHSDELAVHLNAMAARQFRLRSASLQDGGRRSLGERFGKCGAVFDLAHGRNIALQHLLPRRQRWLCWRRRQCHAVGHDARQQLGHLGGRRLTGGRLLMMTLQSDLAAHKMACGTVQGCACLPRHLGLCCRSTGAVCAHAAWQAVQEAVDTAHAGEVAAVQR